MKGFRVRHLLPLLAGATLLITSTRPIQASVPLPPGLPGAGEEHQFRLLQKQGERSLQEKIAVGHQRYQERQAFRRDIVASLRANAAQQREVIYGAAALVPATVTANDRQLTATLLWLAAALCAGWLFLRFARRHFNPEPLSRPKPVRLTV